MSSDRKSVKFQDPGAEAADQKDQENLQDGQQKNMQ